MANIKRGELEFLISLCDKISSISGMSDDAHRLQEIVNRLSAAEEAKLRRTWDAICEKRKVDPTYGRSAKECDRIENKKKNSNIFKLLTHLLIIWWIVIHLKYQEKKQKIGI